MTHRILKAAKKLTTSCYVSKALNPAWRVWFRENEVIMICVGDRSIFESGDWYRPGDQARVVAGAGHEAVGLLLGHMEAAGGTH